MKIKLKPKSRTLGERIGYRVGRLTRASLAFAVCGAVVVLLWFGWFPDLRAPGADLRRVAAATVLTALLAFKIAARVRTAERRRTPRREAISDAEIGLLLLTTVYLLLALSGGVGSTVYPLVYAVVSFLVTFHRLVVGLPRQGFWRLNLARRLNGWRFRQLCRRKLRAKPETLQASFALGM